MEGRHLHSVDVRHHVIDDDDLDCALRAWGREERARRRTELLHSALDKLTQGRDLARLSQAELSTLAACLLARMEVDERGAS